MSVFDLLFVCIVLSSVVTLVVAAGAALRGRGARALGILRVLGVGIAAYLATGLLVSLLEPRRVIAVGDPWCFDDWCLAVEHVRQTPEMSQVRYAVDLRLFSRARRISQRAKGAWIYLVDREGHRYAPEPDASAVPLDVLLGPNESVTTSRVFHVPTNVGDLGLVTGHGGRYCGVMDILVIGAGGCLFHKATMIRIDRADAGMGQLDVLQWADIHRLKARPGESPGRASFCGVNPGGAWAAARRADSAPRRRRPPQLRSRYTSR